MRPEEPGNGGWQQGGAGEVPPWPAAVPREPGAPDARQPAPAARGSRRRRGRGRRALLLAGMALAVIGLAAAALGITRQFLPRTFSAGQRQQIMAWEVAKRWRSWDAGRIFPSLVHYRVYGTAFGGGPDLHLAAQRVGIAAQAKCRDAATPAVARVLGRHGCLAVLRATYDDATHTMAVTVGVAVLPTAAAARGSLHSLRALPAGLLHPGVRAIPFRHTLVARFGASDRQLSWEQVSGPYLLLATVGYADGRPWLPAGSDSYVRTEMLSLARGIGHRVLSALGARPPPPHCPGGPGC